MNQLKQLYLNRVLVEKVITSFWNENKLKAMWKTLMMLCTVKDI